MDKTLLQMAVIGYEAELQRIQEKIAEIQARLNGSRTGNAVPAPMGKSRRGRMSAAARKRIAAAQKKRWAEYRKRHKAA